MLPTRLRSWAWSAWLRLPFASSTALHRAGLEALHAGNPAASLRWFERAARGYRRDLEVEALARLRVHERIAYQGQAADPDGTLDIERRLARLDGIEALEPPFARVPAHALMATWARAGSVRPGDLDAAA